jgi:acetoin utilization deacetylase AcuC-like enzyme
MQVVYTPAHASHEMTTAIEWGLTVGNFERPMRAEVIRAVLASDSRFMIGAPTAHGRAPIDAVHDPGLVTFLERAWRDFQKVRPQREVYPDSFLHPALREHMDAAPEPTNVEAALGYWAFETMTPISEGSYDAARASVDVALTALDLVTAGESIAYGLCRPPGHHAPRAAYGGYCFFNNAAIVAHAHASATGTRVTVLDVDYHHGNGTQQIFYQRDDVQYVSLHGDPNRAYPYFIGHADETGTGRGHGHNINVPLPARTSDTAYIAELRRVRDRIAAFGPSLVVISLGVDTYEHDPIADLGLTTAGMKRMGKVVAELAVPMVVLQEGGYHMGALAANVVAWLEGLGSLSLRSAT